MASHSKKPEDYSHTLLHIRAGLETDRESNTACLQVMVTPLKVKKASSYYEKPSGRRVKFDTLLKPVLSGNDLLPEYMLQCTEEDMEEGCKLVVEAFRARAAVVAERANQLNAAAQAAPNQIVRENENDISWMLKSR